MTSRTLAQPAVQLGQEIDTLLEGEARYTRIVFVSAFVALRTILRLRDRLLAQFEGGCQLRLTVGIDLGGTSRDVLEELLRWNCEVFIFHNRISKSTFHPKIYLFENAARTTLIVGSNNLTDGGFYTNYEASVRYDFELPADAEEFRRIADPLLTFLEPAGGTVQRLTAELINIMAARGQLPTEAEAREHRREQFGRRPAAAGNIPANPFEAENVALPPLLPQAVRAEERRVRQAVPPAPVVPPAPQIPAEIQRGALVWRKPLSASDALQIQNPRTNTVAEVRFAQAGFENPPGEVIDNTRYFRNLFRDFEWELTGGRHADQEHTFVPFRIIIRGRDYGIRNFKISHKPTGEAGQGNITTTLKWGADFTSIVRQENLTDAVFSLYEAPDTDAPFLIEII
jgi:hypothetical protein